VAEVRWAPQAADDLEAITKLIAEDSPHYASLFVMDVLAAVERVASFPDSGRVVPETRDPSLRETILGNYRIIYRVRQGLVEVLTVYHGARLLDPSRIQ
jgi:plasmid stabilization system protein ParE